MHADPAIPVFVTSIFFILIIGIFMRWLKQPYVIGYLLAGILLGPSVFGIIQEQASLTRLGSFGVILLLFFIGMEVSPRRLIENWFISVIGTILQVLVSILAVYIVGVFFNWSLARIILLGFVISLSSTAVVLKLLEDWNEIDTRVGQNVLGILLAQDILIIPMLIVLGFLGEKPPSLQTIALQLSGGTCIILLTAWIISKDNIKLKWLRYLGTDPEMQLFIGLGLCFGLAMLTGISELSSALGAFIAGIIVASAKETHWIKQSLMSIRTLFIAIFFVSIGMLIDIHFIMQFWLQVGILVLILFLTNHVINALILRSLGEKWPLSFYGGSLLSQIGEFSFVIASVGYQMHIINEMTYQLTIAIISLSLLLSPLWIALTKHLTDFRLRHINKYN